MSYTSSCLVGLDLMKFNIEQCVGYSASNSGSLPHVVFFSLALISFRRLSFLSSWTITRFVRALVRGPTESSKKFTPGAIAATPVTSLSGSLGLQHDRPEGKER
jgi:hypothetical protein